MSYTLLPFHGLFKDDEEALLAKLVLAYRRWGKAKLHAIVKKADDIAEHSNKNEKENFEAAVKDAFGAWKNYDVPDDIRTTRHFKNKNISFD